MSFKYSAFIENTPDMREWLESIGYPKSWHVSIYDEFLYTSLTRGWYCTGSDTTIKILVHNQKAVDCRSNHQLFKAVTAIRDDSDYMQWFVFDRDLYDLEDEYTKGDTLLFKKGDWYLCKHYSMIGKTMTHKATIQELQEHFKK